MNENHSKLCPSPEWAEYLHTDVLPQLCGGRDLGPAMLEIGPGPGAATEWLRHRVTSLTAIEIDAEAARLLAERFADTNVDVRCNDATRLPFDEGAFDSVASFTMLHHIPTLAGQNRVLAEALRVLRPGGCLVASDSTPSSDLHGFHIDDTYNPVDPASLITRLQTIGFDTMTVSVGHSWTVRATKAGDDGWHSTR